MYGVIDIGSNTIRLVLYKVENNTLKPMLNKKYAAGLAGYINKKNCLSQKGMDKAVEILTEFREVTSNMGIQEVFPFATASLRNIDNAQEVLETIEKSCGFQICVLSGKEEAVFDYYGAVQDMDMGSGLLVDIGGGSTELVFYEDKQILSACSMPIGSLNLYTRFVDEILPTKKELQHIEDEVEKRIRALDLPKKALCAQPICWVGGTARATLQLFNDMCEMPDSNAEYPCSQLKKVLSLLQEDPKKLSNQILKTAPDRIHTLLPGIVVLSTIAQHFGTRTVITNSYGVREGYLYHVLQERGILHA